MTLPASRGTSRTTRYYKCLTGSVRFVSIQFCFIFLISRATDFRGAFIIKRAISISIRSRNETHIPHIGSFSFGCEMVGGSDKNNHRCAQSSPNEEEEIPEILWLDFLVNVAKLTLTSLFFSLMMMMIFFVVLLSLERVCRDFFPWKTHTQTGGEECSLLIGWDLARTSGPGKWLEGVDIYTGPTPIHTRVGFYRLLRLLLLLTHTQSVGQSLCLGKNKKKGTNSRQSLASRPTAWSCVCSMSVWPVLLLPFF
jgi:hypothetical protein